MKKFDEWLGDRMAFWLATMACFWVIVALVVIPLFFQRPNDVVGWVQYVVQSFFQGVALPVLAFVARIQGEKQERIIKETHDAIMGVLDDIKETRAQETEEIAELKEIIQLLKGGTSNGNS